MSDDPEPVCVWDLKCKLGEGPIWMAHEGTVWFVDIKLDKIHRFAPASGSMKSYDTPPNPGFIVPGRSGEFIVGLQAGLHRFDPASGKFTLLFEVEPDKPGNRLNDGAVDPLGRLWFGSMDNGEKDPTGCLYRLDKTGPKAMDCKIPITNGPTFSPDGRILYHTETLAKTIYAFDVAENGDLSNKRVFATIEDGAGHPDGPVMDSEGCLWTGLYGGWGVCRYSPQGKLLAQVRLPCANVTKMAFAGPDLRTVFVTTAWKGLSDEQRAAQPLAGGLFRFESDVAGLA
ncbi:MAG TPA: SMP-30/gluconolactonase/LRE family protein [Rhizomicrobium sp.]